MNRIIIALMFIGCASSGLAQRAEAVVAGKNSSGGAITRLNIENFGAKGDGNTDNSGAIAAAVKASCESTEPLLIPTGTFAFATPITVSCAHFELYGASRYSSRLRYSGPKTTAALTLSKINNPALSNLTVDANGRADYSVQLTSTHRGVFRDINVRNCIVSCFYTNFSVGDLFENIAVSNTEEQFTTTPQNGISLDGITTASVLTDIRVDGVKNAGIYLGKSATITITGGLLEANAYGIYVSPNSEDNTVTGVDIECNTKQNVALFGSRTTLGGILSSDGGHCPTSETLIEGSGNIVYGGHFVDLTVGYSAKNTTLIGATYQAGAVAKNLFRDLGTGTEFTGLIDLSAGGGPRRNRLDATFGTTHTTAACASNRSPAECGSAVAGSALIAVGSKSVDVNTTAVTADSQILVSDDASVGGKLGTVCNLASRGALGSPRVVARRAGAGFTIAVDTAPAPEPLCFTYLVVN